MNRLVVAASVLSAAILVRAEIYEFDLWMGTLTGLQEVPANTSTATGGGVGDGIWYDDVTNELEMNVAYGIFGFNPLEGNYSGAHLHYGAIGDNGNVVVDLRPIQMSLSQKTGFFQGKVVIPQESETSLLLGGIYMNIHSSKYPAGEIRGQMLLIPEPSPFALLGLGVGGLFFARWRCR